MSPLKQATAFVVSLLICFAAAGLGSVATTPNIPKPTKRLVKYVVRSMDKLAVEFARSVGDGDFPRRLKAVFKRQRASRRSVSR